MRIYLLVCCFIMQPVFSFAEITFFSIENIELNTEQDLFRLSYSRKQDLDKELLSQEIRDEFQQNKFPLSPQAKLQKIQTSQRACWQIKDDEEHYFIAPGLECFRVYRNDTPWWDELYLRIDGYAENPFADTLVAKVTLEYHQQQVAYKNFRLYPGKKIFHNTWGSLNDATQNVLGGTYTVTVEVVFAEQSTQLQSKWRQLYQDDKAKIYQTSIKISQQHSEIKKTITQFYLHKLKGLNELFREIQLKKQQALVMPKEQTLLPKERFSPDKWEYWLAKEYISELQRQRDEISDFPKRFFPSLYPNTHKGLLKFCDLLVSLSHATTSQVYRFHNVVPKKSQSGMEFKYCLEILTAIHEICQQELQVDLSQELGFRPPLVVDSKD